jgi:NitT/TauT family transport system permease protein
MRARVSRGLAWVLGNPFVVSAIVGLGIWWFLAGRVFVFLPTPLEVGYAFVEALTTPEFYRAMAMSLRRVAIASVGAWLMAVLLGIAMAYSWPIETAFSPLVFIGLALPAPLSIFFSILIFGLGEQTTMIALLAVVTPYVVVIIYEGAKSRDKRYAQMATVYQFSRLQRLKHIILPELSPSLMSGARFAFAMSWKIVVLVEALSANTGVGERIHYFFVFNRPDRVIGWALTFTVVMVLMELFVFKKLEERAFEWRPQEAVGGDLVQGA